MPDMQHAPGRVQPQQPYLTLARNQDEPCITRTTETRPISEAAKRQSSTLNPHRVLSVRTSLVHGNASHHVVFTAHPSTRGRKVQLVEFHKAVSIYTQGLDEVCAFRVHIAVPCCLCTPDLDRCHRTVRTGSSTRFSLPTVLRSTFFLVGLCHSFNVMTSLACDHERYTAHTHGDHRLPH